MSEIGATGAAIDESGLDAETGGKGAFVRPPGSIAGTSDASLDAHEEGAGLDVLAAVLAQRLGKTERIETQQTISAWADETFGEASSSVRVAVRANEEMAELLRALSVDDRHPKAAEELADVYIVLCRVGSRLGVDILEEVDRKMQINRAREWRKDGSGHGYHVRKPVLAAATGGEL
jgi:NTP pyrophosphatase (non-canonical NTP hydrolase)